MTPAAAPARRQRQLSLAGDLARRDVSERLGREADVGHRHAEPARPRRQSVGCSDGERPTLVQHVAGVWEGLLAAGVADCPLCGAEMTRSGHAGRCGGCGTTLS